MYNYSLLRHNTVQANRLYGYFAVFLCPQFTDSSPKSDLTCNERSECELRTAKHSHCEHLAYRRIKVQTRMFAQQNFVILNKVKDLFCPQFPSCLQENQSANKDVRTTKLCHPEQSEGSLLSSSPFSLRD